MVRTAKRDTRRLEKQNIRLCDVIAETRALQAYCQHLEDEHHKLNGGGLIPRKIAQKELDDGFEEEIRRLQELLNVCEERNASIDKELEAQREDLKQAEIANVEAVHECERLDREVQASRKAKNDAFGQLQELENEADQLENVRKFRNKVHEEELDAVRDYVEQWLEHGEEIDKEIEEHQKAQSSPTRNSSSNKFDDNTDLEQMLSDFANDYQKLLDDAYAMEKEQLLRELKVLQERFNALQAGANELRDRREREQAETQDLKHERAAIERELAQLMSERANLRKTWEKERREMEQQIDKINEEIQKKEAELERLVAADNELWKQACELELEIRGYRAMMVNEGQKMQSLE